MKNSCISMRILQMLSWVIAAVVLLNFINQSFEAFAADACDASCVADGCDLDTTSCYSEDLLHVLPASDLHAVTQISNLDCGGCYWELALTGYRDGNNSDYLVLTGVANDPYTHEKNNPPVRTSKDGGITWWVEGVDDNGKTKREPSGASLVSTEPISYKADPKSLIIKHGTGAVPIFMLSTVSSLDTLDGNTPVGGFYWGTLLDQENNNELSTQFNGLTFSRKINGLNYFDYGQLAYDAESDTLYIAGISEFRANEKALYVSKFNNNEAPTFYKKDLSSLLPSEKLFTNVKTIMSADTNSTGELRLVATSYRDVNRNVYHYFLRFNAPSIGLDKWNPTVEKKKIHLTKNNYPAKISDNIPFKWSFYAGPVMVIDKSDARPERIYIVWAEAQDIETDSDGMPLWGKNRDIFISYSDHDGDIDSWSAPVRVNDDDTNADQGFPSIQLDSDGNVHIAFIDKREHPDLAQFDVYYALIKIDDKDGRVKVSKNIRLNNKHVPNAVRIDTSTRGGRTIGDYLDMVVAYPDKAYVAYPCGGVTTDANGRVVIEGHATDACITSIDPTMLCFDSGNDGYSDPAVKLVPTEYKTIQAAYNAAVNGDTIRLMAGAVRESITADRNISVTLKGGYDSTYRSNCGGVTTLAGEMIISAGVVAIENVEMVTFKLKVVANRTESGLSFENAGGVDLREIQDLREQLAEITQQKKVTSRLLERIEKLERQAALNANAALLDKE